MWTDAVPRRVRLPLVLTAAVLLAGCAGDPPAATDPPGRFLGEHRDVQIVDHEQVFRFPFGALEPVDVRVNFTVDEGKRIDAWLGTSNECDRYGFTDFAPTARALNATDALLKARFGAGNLCVVLDNTNYAEGLAAPDGPVTVRYEVRMWDVPTDG